MVATILNLGLIVSDPEVRKGRPCLIGTGLRVTDIVMAKQFRNRAPEELAEDYAVPLSHVYAALAYYYEHKDELDEDIRQQLSKADELKEKRVGSKPPFLFG